MSPPVKMFYKDWVGLYFFHYFETLKSTSVCYELRTWLKIRFCSLSPP